MSLDKFITQILNIKEDDLEEITPIMQSDGTSIIKIRLKAHPTVCHYCGGKVKIHVKPCLQYCPWMSIISRNLTTTHSTAVF